MTNTNPTTGIRYTVFNAHELNADLINDFYLNGEDLSFKAAEEEATMKWRIEIEDEIESEIEAGVLDQVDADYERETRLEERIGAWLEGIQIDEPVIEGEHEGVKYGINWLGGAPMLWVFESPHTGYFKLCSPCVPNACDGDNPNATGYEGYDVPESWKEDV